jgi:hypothetical protein
LLLRGKEFIWLLGLDDDQCSSLIGGQLCGQGIQGRASGLGK